MIDRRRFVIGSLAGLAGACSKTASAPEPAPSPVGSSSEAKRMSILILGGTSFIGPHIVEAARARGHTLTLFNRGKTHPKLFPEVERLLGDRDGKLDALRGRKWDAVVDTSGFVPRIVKQSAELLAPSIGHYVFISTISVYKDNSVIGADETAPLMTAEDPRSEDVAKDYGALKAACEQTVAAALPDRTTTIRPGLIVGPYDATGRFTHWPVRMADGGEVLAPGNGATPTQIIDGRDLAAFIVKAIEDRTRGTFNALGPARKLTMKEMLDDCNAAAGSKAKLTWVDAAFLDKHDVKPWSELPAWFHPEGDMAGFGTRSNARAVAAGLTFRPVEDSARDTLEWLARPSTAEWITELPDDKRGKVRTSGISREKEAKVLAAWHAR